MRLKIGTANMYVGNKQPYKDAQLLNDLDLVGFQEGHSGNAEAVRASLRQTHFTFWGKRKDAEKTFAMLDVPIAISRRLHLVKTWARLISHRAQKRNIGMPRAATAARVEKGGYMVTFINTHTNAGVQGQNPDRTHLPLKIKRVAEYVAGMIVLEAMIRNAIRRGDLVVLVGDLNYRKYDAGIWKFSPRALFERTGLRYRQEGLDYIAYSRKFKLVEFKVIPTTRTGSDHPWLVAELTTR